MSLQLGVLNFSPQSSQAPATKHGAREIFRQPGIQFHMGNAVNVVTATKQEFGTRKEGSVDKTHPYSLGEADVGADGVLVPGLSGVVSGRVALVARRILCRKQHRSSMSELSWWLVQGVGGSCAFHISPRYARSFLSTLFSVKDTRERFSGVDCEKCVKSAKKVRKFLHSLCRNFIRALS